MRCEIRERNSFIVDLLPYTFEKEPLDEIKASVDKLIDFLHLSSKLSILEYPCLGGAFSMELARKRLNITACDCISESIDLGQLKGNEENLNVKWVHSPISLFNRKDEFHVILSLGYSFGIENTLENDRQLLSHFYSILAPGGKLILQLIGRDILEKYFQPRFWGEQEDGSFLLNLRNVNYEEGLLDENYVFIKDNVIRKYHYRRKLYYPDQITSLLEQTGYKKIQILGDFDGRAYDDRANALLVVAEKEMVNNKNYIRC